METHPADPRRRPTRPRHTSEDLRVDLTQDGDRYLVTINGEQVTEVYKSRTRWAAGNINGENYGTRKEAVAEVVRRYKPPPAT